MDKNNLKSLANMAKQRLKNGSYTKEMAKTVISKTRASAYFYKNAMAIRKKGLKAEFVTIDLKDDKFERRVFNLLDNNDLLCNPIGKLVDKNYYNSLNEYEKQFYILSLCDKYNQAKSKYYDLQEKIG